MKQSMGYDFLQDPGSGNGLLSLVAVMHVPVPRVWQELLLSFQNRANLTSGCLEYRQGWGG